MLVPTQTDIEGEVHRFEDLRADVACWHLGALARQPVLSTPPRPARRVRAGLRQAVAWLAAFVAIG